MRKVFAFFLSFLVWNFGMTAFPESTYAQNINTVLKKQIKQSPAKAVRILTVGVHGQFKDFDGLQMALNMAQDMDEIRIEKGVIKGSGLIIAENKVWDHGIKISGGWDEAFRIKSDNPEDTTLEGEKVNAQYQPRIFVISGKKVFIENIAFKNALGGAIKGNATFRKCMFINNSSTDGTGGAVQGDSTFYNCIFTTNNTTHDGDTFGGGGGAVNGAGTFYNCTFTNNSAVGRDCEGGAVFGNSTFHNCTFANNSAGGYGGAVRGNGTFYNCTFTNNSSARNDGSGGERYYGVEFGGGGAVFGNSTFSDCIFSSNLSKEKGGAVNSPSNSGISIFSNCVFVNNWADYDGGAVLGDVTLNNCTFYGNTAKQGTGGAFRGEGKIFNSIFYKNTATKKDNDIMVNGNLKIDFSLFNYLSGAADIGANIIMGDPEFVAPDFGDLHLRSDSPCIKKGKRLPGPNKVPANINTKPGIVDKEINMGADEAVLASALEDYKRTRSAASDFAKFKRRLGLSVVSIQDKQRFAISFMDAYGKDYNSNPYMLELAGYLPKGYLSDSEYDDAKKSKESRYATEVLPFVMVQAGLMWAKDGNSAGCNNGKSLEWETAMEFCEGLIHYAGYSDWRLPSRKELAGIMFFGHTEEYYWTSSSEASDSRHVCCVRTVTPELEDSQRAVKNPTTIPQSEKSETQKSEDVPLVKDKNMVPQRQAVEATVEKYVKDVAPLELIR